MTKRDAVILRRIAEILKETMPAGREYNQRCTRAWVRTATETLESAALEADRSHRFKPGKPVQS